MSDIPNLLLASINSLDSASRKQAEQSLNAYSSQLGFLKTLLGLVVGEGLPEDGNKPAVRLAGSIYLKNICKTRWEDDVQPISDPDKASLRASLVPAMLALSSNPHDKGIRAQIAESISLIAALDFPNVWGDLIDQLVSSLSQTSYSQNIAVLQTCHSIFRHWRSQVRSDALFSEINLVLNKFIDPFLGLFRMTVGLIFSGQAKSDLELLAQTMVLLIDIYYDLTCQDLPPAIEDTHIEFFGSAEGKPDAKDGWFVALMAWDPVELRVDSDSTTPSLPTQIKTSILHVVTLFIKLFPETLQQSGAVVTFVRKVWELAGTSGQGASSASSTNGVAYDSLISTSLQFISTAIRSGFYSKTLFSGAFTLSSLIEGIIIPNIHLRETDLEMFEDDPGEWIRLDLSVTAAGTDFATRRQAAADVLQALVSARDPESGVNVYEAETTQIVGGWIQRGLSEYNANKTSNPEAWKAKDSAIWLLTAIASRGGTSQGGVTSTNALVDVVKFFGDHVYQDLEAPGAGEGVGNEVLRVNAIRFLNTFRNQLTKPQLLSVFPLLVKHLQDSQNFVTYTYASITVERVLGMRAPGGQGMVFTSSDISSFAPDLIGVVLSKIESSGATPEKVAENDHLMKCVMRIIITARQSLAPAAVYTTILRRLVTILGVISKNPSNPKFDQFLFESLSGLMRFVTISDPSTGPAFESALFEPFTVILMQDVDQYIPYVFQLLAQMLELHPIPSLSSAPTASGALPDSYKNLLPFLLMPAVWQQKGSIPGLVKLLRAYLARSAPAMVSEGQLGAVLAVLQQRLIPSKINDEWGFELLEGVVRWVDTPSLAPYFNPVILTVLNRMQTSKTDKLVHLFSRFVLFTIALDKQGMGPDYVIELFETIQKRLWGQILSNFILPLVPKMPLKDRKVTAVGMTKLLFQSRLMVQEPNVGYWPTTLQALIKLFSEPQFLAPSKASDETTGFTEIDYEEQTAGYQAAYSRLGSFVSEQDVISGNGAYANPKMDPVGYVSDPQIYLGERWVEFGRQHGGRQAIEGLLAKGDIGMIQPFVQGLASAGYTI